MREQSYPPKRPNMAHFGAPAEQSGRGEAKENMQAAGEHGQQHVGMPLRQEESPATTRSAATLSV